MKGKQRSKSPLTKTEQGTGFYREKHELKPILVHVPKEVHRALTEKALEEDRSLQKTVRRILIEAVAKLTTKPK